MSFLHPDPKESSSGASKFVALALVVLALLGGVAYWFLRNAPEPAIGTETTEAPPASVEGEAPEEVEPEPESPGAELSAFGAIEVTANVDGASVYLDGELVGESPFSREEVSAGRHEVRVEREGYETFEAEVRVRGGERAAVGANLDAVPASLRVESDIAGATVFLDRNYAGTTPLDIKDVSPGEHQLTVSADGHDMYAETVTVGTGRRDIRVNFKNVELGETIAVVHKHRMGSCEGTLVADKGGLRYETSNKNDAFNAPFALLEQFEIDYVDKNLKVKLRKGKNYNFTDKGGNADALFVFHKNVQAFREKM
ncbi:MAG: PEGA domain-containing protein [Vicinamibacteria bacterium]